MRRCIPALVLVSCSTLPVYQTDSDFAATLVPRKGPALEGTSAVDPFAEWVKFSADGRRLFQLRQGGGKLAVAEVPGLKLIGEMELPSPCFDVDGTGDRIVVGSASGEIEVRSHRGESIAKQKAHARPVSAVAISRDGRLVATGDDGGEVALWRIEGGTLRPVVRFQAFTAGIGRLSLGGSNLLLVGSGSSALKLWRAEGGQATVLADCSLTNDGVRGWLSGNGEFALIAPFGGPARLLRVGKDGRAGPFVELGMVFRAAFGAQDAELGVADMTGAATLVPLDGSVPTPLAGGPILPAAVGFLPDGACSYSPDFGFVIWPAAMWRPRTVKIGEDTIQWGVGPSGFPLLESFFEGSSTVAVRNRGTGAAHRIAGTLRVNDSVQTVYFGTVGPGQTVMRTVAPPPTTGEVYVELRVPEAPPARRHRLPQVAASAEDVDRVAQRVFDAARDEMREWLKDPGFTPRLERMSPFQVGFTTSSDDLSKTSTIRYQNLFAMSAEGLAINRTITGAASREELLAEGELMVYAYLCHEMVHAARHHLGHLETDPWREELIANVVETVLTERVVRRIGNSPYRSDTFHRAYDRYTERLGALVTPELRARVEAFIASDGRRAPSDLHAYRMFQADVPGYVYVGARIAQHAVQCGVTFEDVKARYLEKR